MCGIIGYVGKNQKSLDVLITGLESLEYRGYDSAGVAFISDDKLNIVKEQGRIRNLKEKLDFNMPTNIGIGHTRWATHGLPKTVNAHPHNVSKITLVHNGIIENYEEIKEKFKTYNFKSETDTEVAACLLNNLYEKNNNMLDAIKEFIKEAKGAYALGIINTDYKDILYAVKKNSPLIIGVGKSENFIASDVHAILKYTNKYIVLEDETFAKITKDEINIFDKNGNSISYVIKEFNEDEKVCSKGIYDHFMLKEINEQPEVIKKTIESCLINKKIDFSKYLENKNIKKIVIIACGSAVNAGYVGKFLIEEYANIPVDVEIASEFRYKKVFINKECLVIPISQSGETADTLEALKIAKSYGCYTLGIINVVESSIARICDDVIYIKAGPEIAVATTKAYLAQVLVLTLLAIYLGKKNNLINEKLEQELEQELNLLPNKIESLLENKDYEKIAKELYSKQDIFFIGRNVDYALCMEGSLKLKEISYIHSEAYAAGELKHGTISLIDSNTPTIAIITKKSIASKTISNVKEIKSREGKIILVTSSDTYNINDSDYDYEIVIPKTKEIFRPILAIVPLQLISYYVAKLKGCDIDKPKNLAKSVTVE
ncbi:MAG: glutamine--fructose-6-phosphate transaminase (isomerizing) [bacterium]|nr:glutamine--fructose-6-phosphate transaminase (isomerizing) [bacterium]